MEYGLGLLTTGTYEQVLATATWAEQAGLASFALPDHYVDESSSEPPNFDAMSHLAGLARETSTIELAVMMSPITFRHAAVLGKCAITIADMSGGRFALGIGAGWMEREHEVLGLEFPPGAERFDRLEDALGYLRAALGEERVGHPGRFYRLEAHPFQPGPAQQVPIIVGGTGALRTPRLAGTFADEFNLHSMSLTEMETRIARARTAAARAGRHPEQLRISFSSAVVAGKTHDDYRSALEKAAKRAGKDADQLEARLEKNHTLHGTYETVSSRLQDIEQAGVSRFYLQVLLETRIEETGALLGAMGL